MLIEVKIADQSLFQ